jgi:hypothetical protein
MWPLYLREELHMKTHIHALRLKSSAHYGKNAPPEPVGAVLSLIPQLAVRSVRMAYQGSSSISGKYPDWLRRATDVRFVDYSGADDTIIYFSAPILGEAAEEVYAQQEIWTTRPEPQLTAFDLVNDVIHDIRANNAESEKFDSQLLNTITRFRRGVDDGYSELVVESSTPEVRQAESLDLTVIQTATELRQITPEPQRTRVFGHLDMLRASTQAFALRLDSGEEIRGVMSVGDIGTIREMLGKPVTIFGRAVFRPSGRLLRIDADEILPGRDSNSFFSVAPTGKPKTYDAGAIIRSQPTKRGLAAIYGKWPGDETDEEIEEALRAIS